MKNTMFSVLLPLLFVLTGCHTPQVMPAKSLNIQRIALAAPTGQKTGLYATIQSNPAIQNSYMGDKQEESLERSKTFNDLVLAKFSEGVVYNDFNQEVKLGLEEKGFKVLDVTKRQETIAISDERLGKNKIAIPLVSPQEADVVLVPVNNFGYFASSFLASYCRQSFGQYAFVDTKTKNVIFVDWLIYKAPDNKFEYSTYEKLTTDIVPAVEALREVAKVTGRSLVKSVN